MYDNPPSGAAPTDPSDGSEGRIDVRVAFDDDATVAQVLAQCKRAIASSHAGRIDAEARVPDVLIATLRSGRDPEPVAAALLAELEGGDGEKSSGSRFAFLFCERQGALAAVANAPARARHDIKRTAGHLNVLLAAIGGPEGGSSLLRAPAWSVPICSADEARRLREWNAASDRPGYLPNPDPRPDDDSGRLPRGSTSLPARATTLPARIAEVAAASPTKRAVSTESKTGVVGADGENGWTYRELTRVAATIASRLRRSIGREDIRGERVGVYLERGPYLVASLVAVHLTGAAYVPLDPLYPADRVGAMLADARAAAVLTSASGGLAGEIGAIVEAARRQSETDDFEPPVVSLADEDVDLAEVDAKEGCDFGALAAVARPDDLAYVIFTSGSTGRPKGVVSGSFSGEDKPVALMSLVGQAITGTLGLPENGRTLLIGPVYHSAQWAFSYLPLLAGTAVVMRHGFDAADTLRLIDEHQITNSHLVPTQFVRLLRLDERTRSGFDGSSLVAIWHGAAPCSSKVKRDMIDWWGPIVWEYYGSTESAIISTISAEDWLEHPGSLGKPLESVEVRVVKPDGALAEPGEEGQLYFRSQMGTDFEYHKDPKKTEEAHLEPGVFSVGDIGYMDEEGYLYMSDRKIDMIISGGVNIYPAEIEGVLVSHEAVADAAVFGVPNEEFGEEVKAAVELVPEIQATETLAEEIREHCREHLAGYKVPRSVDFEESLPRHPTGKLYKRILRDRYWEGHERRI